MYQDARLSTPFCFPPLPREARASPRQDWPGNEDRMLTDASVPRLLWVSLGLSGRLVPVHLMTISGRKCFPPHSHAFLGRKCPLSPIPPLLPLPCTSRVFPLAWSSFSSAASEALHEHALHTMDNSKSSCKLCMNLSNGLHRLFTDLPGDGQKAFPSSWIVHAVVVLTYLPYRLSVAARSLLSWRSTLW